MNSSNQTTEKANAALIKALHAPVLTSNAHNQLMRHTSKGINKMLASFVRALKYIGAQLLLVVASLVVGFVMLVVMEYINRI